MLLQPICQSLKPFRLKRLRSLGGVDAKALQDALTTNNTF